jgi:hypothetical protein
MPNAKPPVTKITREQLYRRVWTTPLNQIAGELGVSAVDLAKLCDDHAVPRPPRGHWVRKQAGKSSDQPVLPDRAVEGVITLTPTAPEAFSDLVVPTELTRPHPIIAAWLADRKGYVRLAKLGRNAYGDPTTDFTELEDRQHRILDALFRAVDPIGLVARSDEGTKFYFQIGDEKLCCRIRELNEATQFRSQAGPHGTRRVLQPTGKLIFTIDAHFPSELKIKREWPDTSRTSLERRLPALARTLVQAGAALLDMRRNNAERERRHVEANAIRARAESTKRAERNRLQKLIEESQLHATAVLLRRFIDGLETTRGEDSPRISGRPLDEWMGWARKQADDLDPLKRGAVRIFDEISKIQ